MDPLEALGRGKSIFMDHLPNFYPSFENEFQSKTSLSLEDYYLCLCAFMTNYLDRTPAKVAQDLGASGIFHVDQVCQPVPHMKPLFSQYLALESQTADELRRALWGNRQDATPDNAGPYDFKPLRQKPILCAADGRAIILDPVFYSERASAGPLFLVSQGYSHEKANRLFGAFGDAFEMYARGILNRMYPDAGPLLVNRLTCNLRGTTQEGNEVQIADACLDYGEETVLCEMKAVWVREDIILQEDYERYLNHLRERYGTAIEDGERPKGIAQLARAIQNIISGEWKVTGNQFQVTRLIFPILLVHDPTLGAPLHSAFLASEFREALSPDESPEGGNMRKGSFVIAPIIVMTVEDLENLETSVEGFSFLEMVKDYSRECTDRFVPLNNFLATSTAYKDKLKHSRSIAAKSLEVLKNTMFKLFGKSPGEREKTS